MKELKVALVHEWLVDYSGSERVLEQLINIFPEASLFAVVEFLPEDLKWFISNKKVTTTFVQKLPFAKRKYRNYLPLMPLAIEQLDVSGYDLIISSSHAVSKGIITDSNQVHICYCHSPMRYAWDLYHQYLTEARLKKGIKGLITKLILHYIRIWDFTTSNRVDYFIANSLYVAKRIRKTYNREASVIYPPVHIDNFNLQTIKQDFFLVASRMVPYKRIDLIVEAFSSLAGKKLVVIGDGPDFKKIKAKSSGNVEFLGFQPFRVLKQYMENAKAFIIAADEDFGITAVEAQACGTPVIAYKKGGSLESVIDRETGIFYSEQTIHSLCEAIETFETTFKSDPLTIRKNAERFSIQNFQQNFKNYVIKVIEERI